MKSRMTVQRALVMDAVLNMCSHPSADDVYAEIIKSHPNVSKGTVYRNLNILAESGQILRVEVPNAPDRFDFNINEHCHIKCLNCGKVYDINVPMPFSIKNGLTDEGFIIEGYSLMINGICPECKEMRDLNG